MPTYAASVMKRVSIDGGCIDEPPWPPPELTASWVAPEPTADTCRVEAFADAGVLKYGEKMEGVVGEYTMEAPTLAGVGKF